MSPTFFEGPEKKVELVVTSDGPNLRALGTDFWRTIVTAARADILSAVQTDDFDAYLLSESSLFVYDGHITMITCGRTTLVDAVLAVVDEVGADQVALLIYERKNEHFPERQPSSFYDDAARLAAVVPGAALRFGDDHDHRIFVFHSSREYLPDSQDVTLEVLMHGIGDGPAEQFHFSSSAKADVAARLGLDSLLPGYEIDDHAFDPAGYSLNAVKGREYYTLHVTPEEVGSYVSFETNHDFRESPTALVERVVRCFDPESFDVLMFCAGNRAPGVEPSGYQLRKHVRAQLCGYDVTFLHFFRPCSGPLEAFRIELSP